MSALINKDSDKEVVTTMNRGLNSLVYSRRSLFKLSGAIGIAGILQACAGAEQPPVVKTVSATPKPSVGTAPVLQATPTSGPVVSGTKAAGPKRGGTLTVARMMGIDEFNPFHPSAGQVPLQRAVWNSVAHYDGRSTLQPELAERWDISSDGKQVTLKLRVGVKFHSGQEFTAEDVKASVEFASTDPSSTSITNFKTIEKVETPDKYTAVLHLKGFPAGIYDLLDMLYIIDRQTIGDRGKTANGTGPFRLEKFVPNDRAEFAPFKEYWEAGKPYLDKYIVREIPDPSSLTINLEAGSVDCIFQPPFVDAARLKNVPNYVVDSGPEGQIFDIAFLCTKEPFTDKRVRQAVGRCIDSVRFCEIVERGLVKPSCLMWPRQSWAYFEDLEGKLSYDLDAARSLLKAAGLEKGFETEIVCSSQRTAGTGDLAQILQADLAKVGIKAKLSDVESAVWDSRRNKGEAPIWTHSYGKANLDPGTLLTSTVAWGSGEKEGNMTRWTSDEWVRLRSELQSVLGQEKRKPICRKIQEIALDECQRIPVAPQAQPWVYARYLKGFSYTPSNNPNVADLWLEK